MSGISNLPVELLYQIFTEGCHVEDPGAVMPYPGYSHSRRLKHFVKPLRLVSKLWQSIVDDPVNNGNFWYARVALVFDPASLSIMARQLRMLQQTLKSSNRCEIHLELQYHSFDDDISPHDQIMIKLFIYGMNFLDIYWKQFAFIRFDSDQLQICNHFLFCFLQQGTLHNLKSIRFNFLDVPSIMEMQQAAYFSNFVPLCRKPNMEMIRHISQDALRTSLTNVTHLFLPQDWIAVLKLPYWLHTLEVKVHILNSRDETNFHRSLSSQQVLTTLKYLSLHAEDLPLEDEDSYHDSIRLPVHSLPFPHLRKLNLYVENPCGTGALWAARFLMTLDCPVLEEVFFETTSLTTDYIPQRRNTNDQCDLALPALQRFTMDCRVSWNDVYLLSRFRRSTSLQHLSILEFNGPMDSSSFEKWSCVVDIFSNCQFQLRSIEIRGEILDIVTIIFENLDVSVLQSIKLDPLEPLSRLSNTPQIIKSKVKLDLPALTSIELREFTIAETASFLLDIRADRLEKLFWVQRSWRLNTSREVDLPLDVLNEENAPSFNNLQKLTLSLFGRQSASPIRFFAYLARKVQHLDYKSDGRVWRNGEQPSAIQSEESKPHFDNMSKLSRYCTWLEPVKGKVPFPLIRYLTATFYIEGHLDDEYIRESIQNILDRRIAAGALPLKLDVLEINTFKSNFLYYDGQMIHIEATEEGPSFVKSI